jgi:hypothetical protein
VYFITFTEFTVVFIFKMELNNMKLLIFLIIHNIGLTLQQQSQSQGKRNDWHFNVGCDDFLF